MTFRRSTYPALTGLYLKAWLALSGWICPEIAEVDLVRHYTNLSRRNFGVDNGYYPLGSCTMKYNPKLNEEVASTFDGLHPLLDQDMAQGALDMMLDLDRALCEITGMDKFTLQPAAGAHGEFTGLMIIKAYHEK